MKKITVIVLIIAMIFSMCGCQKSLTMKVSVHYWGDGLEGTLEVDGTREYEIENVRAGDAIYEYHDGVLSKELREGTADDRYFIKIVRIENDGVTIIDHSGDNGYNSNKKIKARTFNLLTHDHMPGDLYYSYAISFE